MTDELRPSADHDYTPPIGGFCWLKGQLDEFGCAHQPCLNMISSAGGAGFMPSIYDRQHDRLVKSPEWRDG